MIRHTALAAFCLLASEAALAQTVTPPSAVPGGSSGQVQTNNGTGSFGGLTQAQLTALINPATQSLPGTLPAFPNTTTSFFRGDGTYQTLNFSAIGGSITSAQCPAGTTSALGCLSTDGATLSNTAGAIAINLAQSNTWTAPIVANSFSPTSSTVPVNGYYLSSANQLGISANSVVTMTITSSQMNAKIAMTGNAAGWELLSGATSSTAPVLVPNRGDTTTGFGAQASGNANVIIGGAENTRWITAGGEQRVKGTDPGSAPGAAFAKTYWVTGTNAGSCKLVGYAGTSTTPVTIVDNVGSGC